MRHRMLVALAAVVMPLPLAGPASAAPGNGATRYDVTECFYEDPSLQACVRSRGVTKVTETRSGNLHMVDNSTSTFRLVGGGLTGGGSSRGHFRLLLKNGQAQVVHFSFRSKSTIEGVTCRGSFRFIIIRDQVKKEIEGFSCDGPLPEF